jgi:hypothetical protein
MPTTKISPSRTALNFKRPKLFASAYTRQVTNGEGTTVQTTGNDLSDTNIGSTASFRYDPPGQGLRSTQQIPLDYSLFENHTFFNSAEVNVNVAFERIINSYPFDGTRTEVEDFFDTLSGFEKYVYDQFPKNKGYLFFSGSAAAAGGTFIKVNDFAGGEHPSLSKDRSGRTVLDPGLKSLTIEMHLLVPAEANSNSVVLQKLSGSDQGFTLAISESASTSTCDLQFLVASGSSFLTASMALTKGVFNHVGVVLNRAPGNHRIEFYSGSELASTSSATQEFGAFGFPVTPLTIGSGSSTDFAVGASFIPATSLSGAIDELRFFHEARSTVEQKSYARKGIFTSDEMALYFKFNEPTGSLGNLSNLILDSSGNSLHSRVTNFNHAQRITSSFAVPMTYEKMSLNPVLFPAFVPVVSLNTDLLTSASNYDAINPNLITNLVPQHYLQEGQVFEGFEDEEGTIGDAYAGQGIPGSGEMGSPQLLASFLYVWAKFFDEQKIMLDQMSNTLHVDYDDDGTTSDQFLPQLFRHYGFDAPNFFSNSSVDQFVDAENLGVDIGTADLSLQHVQNQIWRRILTNVREIVNSKGTIHGVKALIRAVGINPDSTLRIREFGGKTTRNLSDARVTKTEVATMIDMSGTMAPVTVAFNAQGIPSNKPFLQTNFLTASRIETGFPPIQGSWVEPGTYSPHGISNSTDDGQLTTGSFTVEALYKFQKQLSGSHPVTQSLVRINVTGSITEPAPHRVLFNVVAISGSEVSGNSTGSIKLFARPTQCTCGTFLELPLTGVNIFDGNIWSIAAGRVTAAESGNHPSASYFLRAARQSFGDLSEVYTTSSFYLEDPDGNANRIIWANATANHNVSGSFITVGSQSLGMTTSTRYLNSTSVVTNPEARVTAFSGRLAQLRFWSKALTTGEWKEHARNFKSVGVEDPRTNFNFTTAVTGAFERLRLDMSTDQIVTESNATGELVLTDFSQNDFLTSGSGFESNTQVVKPETFYYSHLSPRFDEAGTDNKVRVRGFLELENIDEFGTEAAPVHSIAPSEKPNDDTRFTIDFSVVDALDEDIISIFSTLDDLDNTLGSPELRFSGDYPKLAELREVYFNRLTDRMNLKALFEFFKWFDSSIGMFIEQIIPRKTNYLGTNFVIESHMLERPKVRYLNSDLYLDEDLRRSTTAGTVFDTDGTVSR